MKSLREGLIVFSLLFLVLSPNLRAAELITAQPVDQKEKIVDSFVANDVLVNKVFDAVAERLDKPIIVSKFAAQKRVTGNFNLTNPDAALKALARRMALVWYDDGASIYIYDNSEMQSSIIQTQIAGSAQVLNYIRNTGIYDQRFPVRSQGDNNLLFVSGPPLYVNLVKAAASYLDERDLKEELAGGDVAIIPLRHASVTDRIYSKRDQNITIPGMLTVINGLFLEGEDVNNINVQIPDEPRKNMMEDSEIDDVFFAPISENERNTEKKNNKIATGSSTNKKISLVAYPDSNSLIVKGSAEQVRYVRQLVNSLDSSRRQVELSLWIIDVTRSEFDDLGIRWDVNNLNLGGGIISFNQSTLTDSNKFLAQINAISKSGNARIVSRPIILTQENIPALFDNNTSFYARIEGERVASLEKVTYGTMISVVPRLTLNDGVEMEVNIEDGGLSRDSNGKVNDVSGLPEVNRTNINTVARIAKDTSLLIGGYTRDQIEEQENHIPLLADIPLLGNLFKYKANNQQKMVRIFLIQPRLLNENESWDGKQFSDNERIIKHDKQLSDTVHFLQKYVDQSWQ